MAAFILGGETYELISSRLTFAEARAFEKVTGFSFGAMAEDDKVASSATTTQALIWISMKRVRPETKFSDLDSLPIDDIEWQVGDEGEESEEDPTPGEDSQPTG